jgi:branched-chain amino acid transport system substrate-binding protein
VKEKMNRRTFLKYSAAVGATTAISGFPTLLGAHPKEILIASVRPVTATLPDIGTEMRRANQLAVDDINARGGIASMGGAKLRLLTADAGAKEEMVRSEAERLMKEGAVCLTGSFLSDPAMTISSLCEQRGIPFVIDVAATADVRQQGSQYTFRCFPTSSVFASNEILYLEQIMREKNISKFKAVVTNTGDLFGRDRGQTFIRFLKEKQFPVEVLAQIEHPLGIQDLSAEVSEIKALKPDILISINPPGDARPMIRELHRQRVELMGIMGSGLGLYEPEFFCDMKALSEYVMDNAPWFNPRGGMYKEVNARFSRLYPGKSINTHSGYAYLAVLVIADALERSKSAAPEDIREALAKTRFTQDLVIGGAVSFDSRGDNANAETALVQILGGVVKVALPQKAAEAKYIFPMPKQLWERGI